MNIRDGTRRLRALARELERPVAVAEAYASGLGLDAQRAAARRPTPQAPMAGSALVVRGTVLSVPSSATVPRSSGGSVSAGAIAGGSEWGSSIYPQFGPRRGRGAWVGAAIERPDAATSQAEEALEQLVRGAVR